MEKLIIRGGKPLYGEICISGMKNSALPILFGTVSSAGVCELSNLPDVSDIALSIELLKFLGAKVRFTGADTVLIDTREVTKKAPPMELVSKMRGSTYLIGAMLGRFGEARLGMPGGCNFGVRPIDQHIRGFEALGATVTYSDDGNIVFTAPEGGLRGNQIYMNIVSVGATINIMLAAIYAKGITTIENAAREPHIVDMANFLNACGADITGAGTSMIRIRGIETLHGCQYQIAPDMIEAGTYMSAVAATGGRVTVKNIIPKHMEAVTAKLREIGVRVEATDDSLTVISDRNYRGTEIKTNPYPGFPTDMHPQFSALLCLANGVSKISEGIFNGRFQYVKELEKMGAVISVLENDAHITGVKVLHGAKVKACDLRAGACLVIAGLCADSVTTVTGVEYIDRGYQNLLEKLRSLGADLRRVKA